MGQGCQAPRLALRCHLWERRHLCAAPSSIESGAIRSNAVHFPGVVFPGALAIEKSACCCRPAWIASLCVRQGPYLMKRPFPHFSR